MFPKSALTNGIPGAKMLDASGLRNVIADTRNKMNSLLLCGKFRGLRASSCESQPTSPASRSDTGYFSTKSSFLDFVVDLRVKCFSRSAPSSSSLTDSSWSW